MATWWSCSKCECFLWQMLAAFSGQYRLAFSGQCRLAFNDQCWLDLSNHPACFQRPMLACFLACFQRPILPAFWLAFNGQCRVALNGQCWLAFSNKCWLLSLANDRDLPCQFAEIMLFGRGCPITLPATFLIHFLWIIWFIFVFLYMHVIIFFLEMWNCVNFAIYATFCL